jgi:FliI/YscN family ATPase
VSLAEERIDLGPYLKAVERIDPVRWTGRVTNVVGLRIESRGPAAAIGDFCEVYTSSGGRIRTQVIGFRDQFVLSMPLEETDGLRAGDRIVARPEAAKVPVGPALLGRVLDGFGRPADGGPPPAGDTAYALYQSPPGPLEREPIDECLVTGVRAIDGLLPCGKGQRIGIFGGSGVGKSTLLAAMARHSRAAVNVIALIGERNREVREFLEEELGPEGLERSVVVVATSDRPAPLRLRACFVALAAAEYFRDQGQDVLLVMDSVTRLAMAQREIGLAAGEPPSQKGYTPSVFALLPRIFERAGRFRRGSITGFFTVLVEGDDLNEPIADAARAILDGHIVLSRELADAGHYPAIDVLASVSRLAPRIASEQQLRAAQKIREALATYRRSEDLINLGAYVAGSNRQLDAVLEHRSRLFELLRQAPGEASDFAETLRRLEELAAVLAG